MHSSLSDTFDNISFTTSGKLVNKENISPNSKVSIKKKTKNLKVKPPNALKISFDDSAFLNDSFTKHLSQLERDNGLFIKEDSLEKSCTIKPPQSSDYSILVISMHRSTENTLATSQSPKVINHTSKKYSNINNNTPLVTSKLFRQSSHVTSVSTLSKSKPTFASTPNATLLKITTSVSNDRYMFLQSEDNKLSMLGLPQEVLQKYECRNVTRLFPWQLECLSCEDVLDHRKNLVYSAPTSAGKTLVAEILAVKTVLERNKKVIFILPFVSVVREKMFYFQDIFGSSGIRVEGFMGGYNPPGGFKNISVAICTIEKANSLVNRLLEEGKLSDIGAVVVDEMHLIGDPSRGYILELLLTKLNYISRVDSEVQIQIIGMSATLPNLDLLGDWLNAALYVTTFRPIPLNEQCLVNGDIFNSNFMLTRRLEPIPELETDTDNVLQLCLETLLQSCSVLVFCSTKNWCESLAVQIATAFFKIGTSQTQLGEDLRSCLPAEPVKECLEQLKRSPSGLDDVLMKTVSFGVAFHHAGLTMDERDIIEGAFRTGAIRVLVATSTLSSGVNLPARRVIIRSPTFFGKTIDVLSYKQMIGRAGRMGKDTEGESILICQKKDRDVVSKLLSGQLDPISSCLDGSVRLQRALLEIIASGVASTPDEVDTFGRCTLLHQEDKSIGNPITDALDFLIKFRFVRLQVDTKDGADNGYYVATPLAKACLNSSMPPEEGLTLFAELEKARQCLVLETELHLIYLVTPYSAQINKIDWMQFLDYWEKLPASMKRVGELVGIKVSFIINCSRGKEPSNSTKLAIHRRFYTALALQDLVNEVPLNDVAEKFGCNRGALQSLQQSAAAFAGRVTTFSKQLGWGSVELLIGQFQDRLQFGVGRELLDLMRLPILNGQRARILFNGGIESLVDLASCNVLELENVLHKAMPFESKEREGESKQEAEKRQNLRTIFISGKRGLTELEAAQMMIDEAREYLRYEIGLTGAKWTQKDNSQTEIKGNDVFINQDVDKSINESVQRINLSKIQIVNVSTDDQGNKTLDSFEISASPQSIQVHVAEFQEGPIQDKDFNLTSLHLSSSSSSSGTLSPVQRTSDIKCSRNKTKDDVSTGSFFNDSFAEHIELMNSVNKSESLEKPLPAPTNSDSLLTKAFMESFNETLSLESTEKNKLINPDTNVESHISEISTVNEAAVSEETTRKRPSSEISSFSSNCVGSIVSDDDMFVSPVASKVSRRSMIPNNKNDNKDHLAVEVINVCDNSLLFKSFMDELKKCRIISLALGCLPYEEEKQVIGIRKSVKPRAKFTYKAVRIHGFAIYWPGGPIELLMYYIELEKLINIKNFNDVSDSLILLREELMNKTLRIFNAKEQLKLLNQCLGWSIDSFKIEDPCVADWLMDPESQEKSLIKMVKLYAEEFTDILTFVSEDIALEDSETQCKAKASLEVISNWTLMENVTKRLMSEDPKFISCYENEMQIILILTRMEINGMPVNVKALQSYADELKSCTQSLETEAFNIAGRRFSFTSSSAVSKVLNMRGGRAKRKIITNKAALVQYNHPLADIIIQWRKINSTLTNMVYPLLRNVEVGRIRGTCITHNSTGRVSMHEPNIQNVPRDFKFIDPVTNKTHNICIRGAFSTEVDGASNNGRTIIVSADYCQLELRLLAHFSKDVTLGKIMRSNSDIFKAIGAKWRKINEDDVDDTLRQQTKQICYGIIYGIGNKTLADQMNITEDEALDFTESFHSNYPSIRRFIKTTVRKCENYGYVETLLGRRRYLPMINSSDQAEKSRAERQAVNTTVQGSAADIAKQAMILVERKVTEKFRNSRSIPKLILQLHDELLYEVPIKYEDIFARILKKCMQESVKLTVPLPVKVQTGKSWGTLVQK